MKNQINQTVLKRFMNFIQNNRLGHAYLFCGPSNVGKMSTAYAIAKLVNCENPLADGPCDACGPCKKISKVNHPDVHLICEDETGSIKIETVRDLTRVLQLRAYEGRKKVSIIKNAHNLTGEAANALLKTLEEPSTESLLILTTEQADKVMDTVKSRCQQMNFFSLASLQLERQLIRDDQLPEDAAHFLAYYSEGNAGLADKRHADKLFIRKNEIIDQLVIARDSEPFLKKVLSDKEKTKETLDVLASFLRDLILLKAGAEPARLIHRERMMDLEKMSMRFSFEDLQECYQGIVKTEQMLEDNFNIKIAVSLIKERLWPES